MNAIIIDTETTGLNDPQLIEVAWLRLWDPVTLEVHERFSQRYRPSKKIELAALATHHILDEELQLCPDYTTFKLPADVGYIIGHNVDYDWKVIGCPDVRRIDTKGLCKRLWPDAGSHRLGSMVYHLARHSAKQRLQGAHNAMVDAENCHLILASIISRLSWPATWEELWEESEVARRGETEKEVV